jgi:environmental stress-induced protein Ves
MKLTLITANSVPAQPWRNGGGQTRELLTWPAGSDWQLRISRADIVKNGPFSAFPGVQRWFAVLEGAGVTLEFPDRSQSLRPGDIPFAFDGSDAPGCTLIEGPTQDLNFMAQRGIGAMESASAAPWQTSLRMRGLYTVTRARWISDTENLELDAHTLLWSEDGDDSAWSVEPLGAITPLAFWIGFTPGDAT